MLLGVREICDVVLRAKSAQKIGNKIFYKNEPVCYFDTLKTSTLEGAATTVYATGGRGNARLMSWDGERTVTFTMEDALISPIGLSILTGAGLIEADYSSTNATGHRVIQHMIETVEKKNGEIYVKQKPYLDGNNSSIYVMILDDNGEVNSEPYLATYSGVEATNNGYLITIPGSFEGYNRQENAKPSGNTLDNANIVLVDYYTAHDTGAFEVNITPDKFGGTFYLEASTLWRDKATGKDLPAEFIIPSCKVQSNFTFTMSSSGDPSTFTFTMDAFPDYTRWNKKEKVLADIQIIGANLSGTQDPTRDQTWSAREFNEDGTIKTTTTTNISAPIIDISHIVLTEPTAGSTATTSTIEIPISAPDATTYDAMLIIVTDNTGAVLVNSYSSDVDTNTFIIPKDAKTPLKITARGFSGGVGSVLATVTYSGT